MIPSVVISVNIKPIPMGKANLEIFVFMIIELTLNFYLERANLD